MYLRVQYREVGDEAEYHVGVVLLAVVTQQSFFFSFLYLISAEGQL